MNYIIFGASGFIGQNLFEFISSRRSSGNIFKFDITTNDFHDVITADVREPIDVKLLPTGKSVIYNLAAIHVTPGHSDGEYFEANVLGAHNICDFARRHRINTIVFTSSIAVYGTSESSKNEDSLPMPSTAYGASKLAAEYIHKLWQAEDPENRKLVILRPGAVFGKAEKGNFSRLYQSVKKGFFFYPGRKDTKKACVYIKDLVRIIYETGANGRAGVATYNVTYAEAPSIEKICEVISSQIGVNKPQIIMPAKALKLAANLIRVFSFVNKKKMAEIHPDRVAKLMISTDISGAKLADSTYSLNFSLEDAIADWFLDCDKKGLF